MLRKGMIERMYEEVGRTLALLLGFKEQGKALEAAAVLKNASRELTGLPWNLIDTLSADSLIGLLQSDGRLDAGRCSVVATLLHEQGILEEEAGNAKKASGYYRKALRLFAEAIPQATELQTPMFERRVADLNERWTALQKG